MFFHSCRRKNNRHIFFFNVSHPSNNFLIDIIQVELPFNDKMTLIIYFGQLVTVVKL